MGLGGVALCLLIAFGMLLARAVFGQTNLGLTASISNNALVVTITNPLSGAAYDLFGVVELKGTSGSPWTLIQTGAPGQTAFSVAMTPAFSGFFVVATNDIDHDGILNYQDANSSGGSNDLLSITILSPTNGATIY